MVFSMEKKKHLLPENRSKMIEKMMLSRVLLLLSIALKLVLSRSPITQHYKLRLHGCHKQHAAYRQLFCPVCFYLAELCVCVLTFCLS